MTFLPHLRCVDKGAFLLVREGVTSPVRAIYMVNFIPKITKIQELPEVRPLGPHQGFAGPIGGLKAAPRPPAFEKKNTPTTIIPGSAPAN